MKNRSHRLPQSNSTDDWVDGSWTVDCSCGVTFDDGEEMVSCDECGVWVHTRCSRFVKGETSFACHNCKKNSNNHSIHSSKKPSLNTPDTEETEVAQLLIELPTKTDTCPPPNPFVGPVYRPPFRLWAEVPMEDRVHVQGVPGGDPSLFQGMSSSVFTSELWRCSGYVPKKFNFQYREFSCWEEEGGENPASQGADVLFSLSKEVVPSCIPVRAFERKQEGGEKVLFGSRLQSWGKKEKNKLRAFGSHSSKRRKEDDRSVKKKKARSDADRVAAEFRKIGSFAVAEAKKGGQSEEGGAHLPETDVAASKTEERKKEEPMEVMNGGKKKLAGGDDEIVAAEHKKRVSIPVTDAKMAGVSDVGGVQIAESDASSLKSEERKRDGVSQTLDIPCVTREEKKEDMLRPSNACDQMDRADGDSKPKLVIKSFKAGIAEEAQVMKKGAQEGHVNKTEDQATGISSQADVPATSQDECDDNVKEPIKKEPFCEAVHGLKQPEDESHRGDPSFSMETKLVTAGSCQTNEKISQQVNQKQPKFLRHSMSMCLPSSTNDGLEDSLLVASHKKQAKNENDLRGDANGSAHAKPVAPGSSQKNEKTNQPVPQSSAKLLKHSISMHPSLSETSTNTISDQEYALRLHQELNSSPRVPRVPRLRQASGLQTSQSAPSMLSKRSSHAGGRDQAFRRKNKEAALGEGSHNSQESIDETRKAGRAMSSPDRKWRESTKTSGSAKKDSQNSSPDILVSLKKSDAATGNENNSCLPSFEAGGDNALSIKSSSRDVVNDDSTTRTLPGLIDEILSKHKCSTYEELCDAVRLHWHNVRKPNGERYAYSSHSHAVLDCLRNRSEWAHLIDRGPKTNSSKRRRKVDSDTPTVEELETEEARSKPSSREVEDKNGDSHREDFPKGKRKARKRRRLESRGGNVEEARKRKHVTNSGSAILSDDDDNDDNDDECGVTLSHSGSEGADGICSEESQGAVDHLGVEASTLTSPDGSR